MVKVMNAGDVDLPHLTYLLPFRFFSTEMWAQPPLSLARKEGRQITSKLGAVKTIFALLEAQWRMKRSSRRARRASRR